MTTGVDASKSRVHHYHQINLPQESATLHILPDCPILPLPQCRVHVAEHFPRRAAWRLAGRSWSDKIVNCFFVTGCSSAINSKLKTNSLLGSWRMPTPRFQVFAKSRFKQVNATTATMSPSRHMTLQSRLDPRASSSPRNETCFQSYCFAVMVGV